MRSGGASRLNGREAVQRQKQPRPEVTVEDAAVWRRHQKVLANGEADAVWMVRVRLARESGRCQSGPGIGADTPSREGSAGASGATGASNWKWLGASVDFSSAR
jgi:hypothetical protein